MPTDLIVQATLGNDSALPKDQTVNAWSFWTPDPPTNAVIDDIFDAVQAFYAGIQTYLSSNLSGALRLRAYNRADLVPRVPLREEDSAFTPGTAAALPDEVACCLSIKGAFVSGAPRARRRGRLFIGPLGANAGGNGAAANRPVAAFLTALTNQAGILMADSDATPEWNWTVYSQADGISYPVTGGWADNAFDTIRSRGVAPTSRTTFGSQT